MYVYGACLFYVCCSDSVGVCGNVCCVAAVVKDSVFYVCMLYVCGAVRYSCMGSMSVSSCRWCMFVSCVHHVAVLNAAFCMTCSLLMLVEDARGDHMDIKNKLEELLKTKS